jgi:hypothetical protein
MRATTVRRVVRLRIMDELTKFMWQVLENCKEVIESNPTYF